MDVALPIREYLPASYKNRNDGEYIDFLWESFVTNYTNQKYQFAVLAYHMLYMCFVYFSVWQIKHSKKLDYDNAAIFLANQRLKEIDLVSATSPFAFSALQERTIFRFLRLTGCDPADVSDCAQLVEGRNEIAHPNGHIFFNDQKTADERIANVLGRIDLIQSRMQGIIHECVRRFLVESWNPAEREYQDPLDQIQEVLIHANYFSQKDIEAALLFDITALQGEPSYEAMARIFESFKQEYKQDV